MPSLFSDKKPKAETLPKPSQGWRCPKCYSWNSRDREYCRWCGERRGGTT